VKNFHISMSSRPALGSTQPPIQWVSRVKRLGCEADHSLTTSAEVKKTCVYTSTSSYTFMAQCLISYAQNNCTFYLSVSMATHHIVIITWSCFRRCRCRMYSSGKLKHKCKVVRHFWRNCYRFLYLVGSV
jgi:hypothetical protein